jgi:hypothetical protein
MKKILVITPFMLATLDWRRHNSPAVSLSGEWAGHSPEFAGAGRESIATIDARQH